jgi:hypothetical protein
MGHDRSLAGVVTGGLRSCEYWRCDTGRHYGRRGHRVSGGRSDELKRDGRSTRWGHRWTYQRTPDGQDTTIVTEIYDCSRAPEEERRGMDNGNTWAESMTRTLERLDTLCTGQAG